MPATTSKFCGLRVTARQNETVIEVSGSKRVNNMPTLNWTSVTKLALVCVVALSLSACGSLTGGGSGGSTSNGGPNPFETREERERREQGTIFGEGGIFGGGVLFGGESEDLANVNKYLWQASMETTQVLPIQQADFRRGVIQTQWYAPQGVTNEQMRLVVLVSPGKGSGSEPGSTEIPRARARSK